MKASKERRRGGNQTARQSPSSSGHPIFAIVGGKAIPVGTICANTIRGGAAIRPVWIRLPAPGERCPYTGLSRSTLFNLCAPCKANNFKPKVKSSAPLRSKNSLRGARLINFESLDAYLRSFETKAA